MNSLAFLILRGAKNGLLELRRKPGKLVLYLLVILTLAGMIALTLLTGAESAGQADIAYLKGIIFAFFLLFFIGAVRSGLSQGSTLFGMEDVNLLFVSPVNPRSILLYGVFRVVKTMALASIFILFQGENLRNFGVGAGGILILYAGYLLTTVVTQLLGLLIYSMTNGRKNRQRLVRVFSVLIFLPLAAAAAWRLFTADGGYMEALRRVLDSPFLSYTPILGWAAEGIIAFITGRAVMGALFFGLLFLSGAAAVAVIFIGKPDYFEDVLVASETQFERKRAMAEGQVNMEAMSGRRVRVKATGVGGRGAPALFYKHVRESFRANRFGLWGVPTLVMAVGAAAYTWIMGTAEAGGDSMFTLLMIMMGLQVLLIGTGRGMKETYTHYIYMIPERPFPKMVWSNLEIMLKAVVESVLVFGAAGLIAGESPLLILTAVMTYTLFSALLVAVNFVSLRFAGADMSTGILIVLYMLAVVLAMLPGAAGAILAGAAGWGLPATLGILSAWELLAAFGCFYASRGILHNCDMVVARQLGQ